MAEEIPSESRTSASGCAERKSCEDLPGGDAAARGGKAPEEAADDVEHLVKLGLIVVEPIDLFNAAYAGGTRMLTIDVRGGMQTDSTLVFPGSIRMDAPGLSASDEKHAERSAPSCIADLHEFVPHDMDRLALSRWRGREVLVIDGGWHATDVSTGWSVWCKTVTSILLGQVESPNRVRLVNATQFARSYPEIMAHPTVPSPTAYPSEVLAGRLYLGNARHAMSEHVIAGLRITHVVNAAVLDCPETANRFSGTPYGVSYCDVAERDLEGVSLAAHFDRVYAFVVAALHDKPGDGRVLIHCRQGVSRSSTLAIYCVMRLRNIPLADAYRLVFRRRESICPNDSFRKQLIEYERRHRGTNSVSEEEIGGFGHTSQLSATMWEPKASETRCAIL